MIKYTLGFYSFKTKRDFLLGGAMRAEDWWESCCHTEYEKVVRMAEKMRKDHPDLFMTIITVEV